VAESIERLDQLAEHPLPRRPFRAPLHPFELVVGQQRRQLREPCRRVLLQDADERVAARLASHASDRLEHRKIRLARTILLNALPPPDTDALHVPELRKERFDERRLPDPGFTRHEDEPSLAADCRPEEPVQLRELGVAADQARRGDRDGRRAGPGCPSGARRAHGADETASPPGAGLEFAPGPLRTIYTLSPLS